MCGTTPATIKPDAMPTENPHGKFQAKRRQTQRPDFLHFTAALPLSHTSLPRRENNFEKASTNKNMRAIQIAVDNPRDIRQFLFSHGAVAQLGERLNGIQEAVSSILSSSTRTLRGLR